MLYFAEIWQNWTLVNTDVPNMRPSFSCIQWLLTASAYCVKLVLSKTYQCVLCQASAIYQCLVCQTSSICHLPQSTTNHANHLLTNTPVPTVPSIYHIPDWVPACILVQAVLNTSASAYYTSLQTSGVITVSVIKRKIWDVTFYLKLFNSFNLMWNIKKNNIKLQFSEKLF